MLGGIVNQVKDQAAQKMRHALTKIVLALGALILLLLSIGFFVAAASRALADLYGALIADLILGGVFLLLAVILVALASRSAKAPVAAAQAAPQAASTPVTATIAAFAYGFARGLGTKRRPQAKPTAD